jgi:hypothetical protein
MVDSSNVNRRSRRRLTVLPNQTSGNSHSKIVATSAGPAGMPTIQISAVRTPAPTSTAIINTSSATRWRFTSKLRTTKSAAIAAQVTPQ